MTITATLKPGEFRATCTRPRWVAVADLPEEIDPDDTRSRWNRKTGRSEYLTACARTFTDREEFTNHTQAVHGSGLFRFDGAGLQPNPPERATYAPRIPVPVKMWRPPTRAKTLHQIRDLEPGAAIVWQHPTGVASITSDTRTGQVWCLGPSPRSVWVVPDVPIVREDTAPGWRKREQAVLLSVRNPIDPVVLDAAWQWVKP